MLKKRKTRQKALAKNFALDKRCFCLTGKVFGIELVGPILGK